MYWMMKRFNSWQHKKCRSRILVSISVITQYYTVLMGEQDYGCLFNLWQFWINKAVNYWQYARWLHGFPKVTFLPRLVCPSMVKMMRMNYWSLLLENWNWGLYLWMTTLFFFFAKQESYKDFSLYLNNCNLCNQCNVRKHYILWLWLALRGH